MRITLPNLPLLILVLMYVLELILVAGERNYEMHVLLIFIIVLRPLIALYAFTKLKITS